jgi:hypothetical protein
MQTAVSDTPPSARGNTVPDDCHARVRQLYAYWRTRCRDGMPQRADIDPIELRDFLPRLTLVDVLSGPRFHYRVAGTDIVRDLGHEITGRYLDEVHESKLADILSADYSHVVEQRRPLFHRHPWPRAMAGGRCAEVLYLPLGHRRRGVEMVLSYTECAAT